MGVAIHNKNGKGLLPIGVWSKYVHAAVAIHNKNGKGLLRPKMITATCLQIPSQSTIKMEKGYYRNNKMFVTPTKESRNPQ